MEMKATASVVLSHLADERSEFYGAIFNNTLSEVIEFIDGRGNVRCIRDLLTHLTESGLADALCAFIVNGAGTPVRIFSHADCLSHDTLLAVEQELFASECIRRPYDPEYEA